MPARRHVYPSAKRTPQRRAGMLAAGILWGFASLAAAGPEHKIVVIASSRAPSAALTNEQVADIFLGRSAGAGAWRPIDSSDEALRDQFYKAVAGITANRARAQWARLVFAARLAPPREMSAEEAVGAVGREDADIAYVFRNRRRRTRACC